MKALFQFSVFIWVCSWLQWKYASSCMVKSDWNSLVQKQLIYSFNNNFVLLLNCFECLQLYEPQIDEPQIILKMSYC